MADACGSVIVYRDTTYPCGLPEGHAGNHENEAGTLCWVRWEAA